MADLIMQLLQSSGLAVLVANLFTMFIDDAKLSKASGLTKALLGFLNLVSLNVFGNKNLTEDNG